MDVLEKLDKFYLSFKYKKGVIGKSVLGKDLYYFKVRKTDYPKVIAVYSVHAREYITCYLALSEIKYFLKKGKVGTVYFIPCLNPDGVEETLTKPLYKANANGVDLNVNFDAKWGKGKLNKRIKGDENYIGEFPFSEPETKALKEFTEKIKPNGTLAYHSKGEEIYYGFSGMTYSNRVRDKSIASRLGKITGYAVKTTPDSCGGYKDWCVDKLKIPAFTIEVGSDFLSHPIGRENLSDIYKKNKGVINAFTEELCKKNL